MKLIVCGPRDWTDAESVHRVIHKLGQIWCVEYLWAGCASGVDRFALDWARDHSVPYLRFEADWKGHGRAAGPLRNQRMLDTTGADRVLAFKYKNEPVTRGTLDMVTRAVRAGVSVEFVSFPRVATQRTE